MYSFYPPAFILVDFIMYNVFSFLLLGTALNEHIIYVDIQRFKNKILLLLLLLLLLLIILNILANRTNDKFHTIYHGELICRIFGFREYYEG